MRKLITLLALLALLSFPALTADLSEYAVYQHSL